MSPRQLGSAGPPSPGVQARGQAQRPGIGGSIAATGTLSQQVIDTSNATAAVCCLQAKLDPLQEYACDIPIYLQHASSSLVDACSVCSCSTCEGVHQAVLQHCRRLKLHWHAVQMQVKHQVDVDCACWIWMASHHDGIALYVVANVMTATCLQGPGCKPQVFYVENIHHLGGNSQLISRLQAFSFFRFVGF